MKNVILALLALAVGCDTCVINDIPVTPSDRPTPSEQPARIERKERVGIPGELFRNAGIRLDRENVGPHEVARATVVSGDDVVLRYRRSSETYDNRTDQGHVERIFIRISRDIGLGKHEIDGTKIAIHYEEEGMAVIGNVRTRVSGTIMIASVDAHAVTASLDLTVVTDDGITRTFHDNVDFCSLP